MELLILVVPLLWAAAVQVGGELADKRVKEREQEVLLLARRRAFEMCREVLDRPRTDAVSASATWRATRALVESIDHALVR
jgi:hypothetical protein